ncbi:MAG: chromosome segregation protein SMC, partial [Paraclostridium sp.]
DINYIKSNTKYIALASDLVSYDERYKNVVENVLGRTIVIENMEQAIKFARETNHKYKVVTLDGEILNPGGSLTGGTLRTSGNILSRKRLIEEFKDKIEKEKSSIETLEINKVKVNDDANKVTNKIEENNELLNKNEKLLVVIEANIKNITEEVSSLESSLNKLGNEEIGLKENLDYTLDKTKSIKAKIQELENKHNLNKNEIESLTSNLKESNNVYEIEKLRFDNLNLEYVKDKQVYEGLVKDIQRINKDIITQQEHVKIIENELNKNKLDKVKLEDQIKIETSEKENLEQQLMDENKKLSIENQQKDSMKKKYEELSIELKNIDRQYMNVKESLFKVENKLERLENNQDTYISKLFEEYELTLAEAMNFKDESIAIDKKNLDNLKRSIKSLGNVNLDSIEEYKEIKERYDFYSEQKKDLEDSIEIIERLIDDLQESMKKEFKTNFDVINENFKVVYKRLFGGGNGELIIVDKQNTLESDIEIVAQPPGKKMKNLNLLSGGEKALTAISILFAILLAKPTPFCILDEIEAPLDDANIFRFGEFLKELANDTQFISITHRRGTMEAADYIYGVTMQEKAISKVISLKLQEAKELTEDII